MNKYIFASKISGQKFRDILWLFREDLEAAKVLEITGVSRLR
jgi:transposase